MFQKYFNHFHLSLFPSSSESFFPSLSLSFVRPLTILICKKALFPLSPFSTVLPTIFVRPGRTKDESRVSSGKKASSRISPCLESQRAPSEKCCASALPFSVHDKLCRRRRNVQKGKLCTKIVLLLICVYAKGEVYLYTYI